jgi:hypothetical protein
MIRPPRARGRLLTAAVGVVLCLALPAKVSAQGDAQLLDILIAAYPDHLDGHENGVLLWKDGTRMRFDEGMREKDFETLLNRPSLKDQFYARYPVGQNALPPGLNIDPGRVRHQGLFAKMYGDCLKGEAAHHLVDVVWLPRKWGRALKITRVNGVADKLRAVSAELDELPAAFDKYLFPSAGTYNCRAIAGTDRVSPHGLGIAIDIATKDSHYWRWTKPDAAGRYPYRNAIPKEVVDIFERHGFIWGGRWYHYDTMHFEYRPELIAAARALPRN